MTDDPAIAAPRPRRLAAGPGDGKCKASPHVRRCAGARRRTLQKALHNVKRGFVSKVTAANAKLPEFDALREEARAIKDDTLSHLDLISRLIERQVTESGGAVHFARAAADARAIVLKICRTGRRRWSPKASRWSPRRSG